MLPCLDGGEEAVHIEVEDDAGGFHPSYHSPPSSSGYFLGVKVRREASQ
jgi:hypothetical protein